MSRGFKFFCHKALWDGMGGDAGCCNAPAYGPTPVGWQGMPLIWACPQHGGPPEVAETVLLRDLLMAQENEPLAGKKEGEAK